MATSHFRFCDFNNTGYVDWESEDDTGITYTSYLHTFYHVPDASGEEDIQTWMHAPYIYVYTDSSAASDRSLLLQGVWDWSVNEANTTKWSPSQQVYKYKSGYSATYSRTKIRGRGRSLQLRFNSETGKNFKLYGWGIWYGRTDRP